MNKLTAIRIKYNDGTFSDEKPVSVLSENVEWDNTHTLVDVLGSIDVDVTGTIQDQISQLLNAKADKSDVTDLQSSITSSLNIKADKSDVTDLQSSITSSLNIKADKSDVTDLQSRITSSLDEKADKDNVTDLQSTITSSLNAKADKSDVTDLTSSLNAKADKSDVTDLQSTITSSLDEKADKDDVIDLQSRITSSLDEKADKDDVTDLQSRITSLENNAVIEISSYDSGSVKFLTNVNSNNTVQLRLWRQGNLVTGTLDMLAQISTGENNQPYHGNVSVVSIPFGFRPIVTVRTVTPSVTNANLPTNYVTALTINTTGDLSWATRYPSYTERYFSFTYYTED